MGQARVGKAGPKKPPPVSSLKPGADAKPGSTGTAPLPGEEVFNSCRRLPPRKRVVRPMLKPDASVMDLIDWISSITCAQFIVGVPVKGKKITILSPELITPEESYRLFLAALDSVGLTVEMNGKFLRVIQNAKARFAPLPVRGPDAPVTANRRYATQLVQLQHLDAVDFTNKVLNRLKSQTADIVAYHSSLIITDLSDNIKRMLRIIREFDVPDSTRDKIWIVRVKHMSVLDMASRISEIATVLNLGTGKRNLKAQPPKPRPKPKATTHRSLLTELTITKIVPDVRTNSLVVVANERAYEWMLAMVRRLDRPLESGIDGSGSRFHVYPCKNANCNELAAALGAIAGVEIVGSLGAGGKGAKPRKAPPPPRRAAKGATKPSALLFESDIRVAFDAPTNSLLVMSTFKDYQSLMHVIEALDIPRKQVFIQATIMEVLVDKSRELGVSYHGGMAQEVAGQSALAMGGFNASQTMNPTTLVNNLGGLSAALFGPTTGALGNSTLFKGLPINIPSFGAFLTLLQTNNDVNILSRPDLLIMNNQEGEITIGEVLPFPSSTTIAAGLSGSSGYQPFTSVQRQPVELKLKLVPSVNESDIIRLDVDQQISDVTSPNYNNMGPATSKRSIKTTVVVRDQQTVVVGGLMADRALNTVEKIPILGDIPVLGFFFRHTTKQLKKSNILIVLTPYVISDLADLRRVARRKLRERRDFIERESSLEDTSRLGRMGVDYHRKRGMLEEINRAVREMERDEAVLRRIRERDLEDQSTPIVPVEHHEVGAGHPQERTGG